MTDQPEYGPGHPEETGHPEEREHPEDSRWIALAREHYNPPPATPARMMWAAIEETIGVGEPRLEVGQEATGTPTPGSAGSPRSRPQPQTPRWGWAAAAMVVLSLGVVVGRWSSGEVTPSAPDAVAAAGADVARPGAGPNLHRAAAEHLGRSEAFLVGLRADAGRGQVDPAVSAWAGALLTETRLLLDSRAARDPSLAGLLRDLEWILVQVNALPEAGVRRGEELQLLTDGMAEQDVLFRLRAQKPPTALSTM